MAAAAHGRERLVSNQPSARYPQRCGGTHAHTMAAAHHGRERPVSNQPSAKAQTKFATHKKTASPRDPSAFSLLRPLSPPPSPSSPPLPLQRTPLVHTFIHASTVASLGARSPEGRKGRLHRPLHLQGERRVCAPASPSAALVMSPHRSRPELLHEAALRLHLLDVSGGGLGAHPAVLADRPLQRRHHVAPHRRAAADVHVRLCLQH